MLDRRGDARGLGLERQQAARPAQRPGPAQGAHRVLEVVEQAEAEDDVEPSGLARVERRGVAHAQLQAPLREAEGVAQLARPLHRLGPRLDAEHKGRAPLEQAM